MSAGVEVAAVAMLGLRLLALGLIAVCVLLFVAALVPRVRLDNMLRRAAAADYDTARGTAHRRLLEDAEKRWNARRGDLLGVLAQQRATLNALATERDGRLRRQLERQIASVGAFRGIPGIGTKLATTLQEAVGRDGLAALAHPSWIRGIGVARAEAIAAWHANAMKAFEGRLAGDFAGKQELMAEAEPRIAAARDAVSRLAREQHEVENLLTRIREAQAPLATVSRRDFRKAWRKPGYKAEELQTYARGVFAEWQRPPEWFERATGSADSRKN